MSSEWKETNIGEIVELVTKGTTPPEGKGFVDNGINYIKSECINYDGSIDETKFVYIDDETHEKFKRSQIKEKDILFSMAGAFLGKNAVVQKHTVPANTNQALAIIRVEQEKALPEFVAYSLRTKGMVRYINSMTAQSAQPNINFQEIKSLPVNLPPLQEQKRIAHILGTLDDKIELNRKMNQTLEAMAQALFQSWFVDFDPVLDNALAAGNPIPEPLQKKAAKRNQAEASKKLINTNPALAKLFPSTFVFNETLNKWIPEGWEVNSFGDLIESTIGGDWGKEFPDEKHTEKVAIIRGTDIPSIKNCNIKSAPNRFVQPKKLASRKLAKGDIVIEVSGGSPTQPTGRSLYITENVIQRLGGVIEPASFCRRFRPKNENFGIICSEQLTYIYGIGKMWEYQNQSTGISNFQTPYFLDAELVLIPNENDILTQFSSTVKEIKNKSTSNESFALTQLRDTLLPKLISGKIKTN